MGVSRYDIQSTLTDWGYQFEALSSGVIGTKGLTDVVLFDPALNLLKVNMLISTYDDQCENALVLTALGGSLVSNGDTLNHC